MKKSQKTTSIFLGYIILIMLVGYVFIEVYYHIGKRIDEEKGRKMEQEQKKLIKKIKARHG